MKYSPLVILAATAMLACGCSHTIQGVQQDATDNAPVAKAVVQQADQSLSKADAVTSVAVSKAGVKLAKLDHEADIALLTPEIKADIIADKDFDNDKNQITVNSSVKGVYLRGHVTSPALKAKADQIASGVISRQNLSVGLHDQLAVSAS
jgi:osmotically-inducible protein OsmY